MDVIEKRGNRNLDVCEIGFPSRQKTGSAFQVYGAMRSANVKSVLVRHDNSSMSI